MPPHRPRRRKRRLKSTLAASSSNEERMEYNVKEWEGHNQQGRREEKGYKESEAGKQECEEEGERSIESFSRYLPRSLLRFQSPRFPPHLPRHPLHPPRYQAWEGQPKRPRQQDQNGAREHELAETVECSKSLDRWTQRSTERGTSTFIYGRFASGLSRKSWEHVRRSHTAGLKGGRSKEGVNKEEKKRGTSSTRAFCRMSCMRARMRSKALSSCVILLAISVRAATRIRTEIRDG